jgi:RNA polymerase sigma-70 factor (ECF subfamily)
VKEEDAQLVRRTLSGDLQAWGEIVKRYKEKIFGLALGIVGEPADADDIVQETFIRAYDKLDQYDIDRKFSPWLFTVAANLAKNKLRRDKFTKPLKHPNWLTSRGSDDPAELAQKEKENHKLRKSLGKLDYKYRAPMVLRYYIDLSYDEISEITDLPSGTVKTRLHRGKKKLKEILEGEQNGRK